MNHYYHCEEGVRLRQGYDGFHQNVPVHRSFNEGRTWQSTINGYHFLINGLLRNLAMTFWSSFKTNALNLLRPKKFIEHRYVKVCKRK
jgi:hypothetical protein